MLVDKLCMFGLEELEKNLVPTHALVKVFENDGAMLLHLAERRHGLLKICTLSTGFQAQHQYIAAVFEGLDHHIEHLLG